jgi:acylphosphatase
MAKHLTIVGLVQGVGYRASFEARARALKLSGWVRNRADGSVEAIVRGDAAAVDGIIEWARRGPAAAQVRHMSVVDVADDLVHDQDFKRLPTH